MAHWQLTANYPSTQVEYVDPHDLKSDVNHARRHNRQARRALTASIRQNGLIEPIVIDENSTVLSGELRRQVCLELDFELVPVLRIAWLTEPQKRAYRIAANRIPELGSWDSKQLRIELDHLVATDIELDLDSTGFETGEIDLLLQHDDAEQADTEPLPDPPAVPISRPGDLWLLGEHRLLCGSCLEEQNWTRLMGGEQARLCLTDPPYNVPIKGHVTSGAHAEFAMASGEMSSAEFACFLSTAFERAIKCTLDGGVHLIAIDWRHLRDLQTAADPLYSEQLNLIIWTKSNAGMGSLYRSQHELFALYKVGQAAHVNNVQLGRYGRNRSNVWTYPGANTFRAGRDADLAAHPTVKPTALVADAILDLTHPGEIVIDGFGGSGTLLLAAEQTRRKARVIELEPRYVDVAIRRWEAMTWHTAELEATGEAYATVGESRSRKLLSAPTGGRK